MDIHSNHTKKEVFHLNTKESCPSSISQNKYKNYNKEQLLNKLHEQHTWNKGFYVSTYNSYKNSEWILIYTLYDDQLSDKLN